jgi:hypothetical protein
MFDKLQESSWYSISKLLIMTGIGIFTVITLANDVSEMRSSLAFQTKPITSRCIPLFRKAQALYDKDPDVQMLYDYRSGTVDLRVCSLTLTREEVATTVDSSLFDPLAYSLDQAHASGCTRAEVAAVSTTSPNSPTSNVTAILSMTPLPDAWAWQYATSEPDSGTVCELFFRFMNNPVCPSNATSAVAFRKTNNAIFVLTIVALSIECTVQIGQTVSFCSSRSEDDDSAAQAFADHGLAAGLYMLYLVFIKDEKVKESPDVPYVWPKGGFFFWFLFINDALSLIASAVSIYGCAVSSFAKTFALIILKAAKLVYTFVMAVRKGRRDSIPYSTA